MQAFEEIRGHEMVKFDDPKSSGRIAGGTGIEDKLLGSYQEP